MRVLLVLASTLLLVPAALAGIGSGVYQMLRILPELSGVGQELIRAAEPLWPVCQSLLCVMVGAVALYGAVGVLIHGLKSTR